MKPLAMKSPRKSEGLLATTSPATRIGRDEAGDGDARPQGREAAAQQHEEGQQDERSGPVGRAQRQSRRRVRHERLEHACRWTVGSENGKGPTERTRPTKSSTRKKARSRQRTNAAATSGEDGHGVGGGQEPDVLGVANGRRRPGARVIGAVEVPVAEAPDDVRRIRGGRGRRDRLGVLQDVDAVGRLHLEARDPPEAGAQGQDRRCAARWRGRGARSTPAARPRRRGSTGSGPLPRK